MGAMLDRVWEAQPAAASLARRTLSRWLHGLGWPSADTDDLVLAVNEAVSNVIDHAYGDQAGDRARMVRLRAEHLSGPNRAQRVLVEVSDGGRWRPAPPDPGYRGLGLKLMSACVSWLDIHRTPTGTRVQLLSHPIGGGDDRRIPAQGAGGRSAHCSSRLPPHGERRGPGLDH